MLDIYYLALDKIKHHVVPFKGTEGEIPNTLAISHGSYSESLGVILGEADGAYRLYPRTTFGYRRGSAYVLSEKEITALMLGAVSKKIQDMVCG